MRHRLTLEDLKKACEQRDYKFVSMITTFSAKYKKFEALCPKEHKVLLTWDNFKQGSGCPDCVNRPRMNIEKVRKAFQQRGFTLTTNIYTRAQDNNLSYICPKGHSGHMCWASFRQGSGCAECAGSKRYTLEQVKGFFEQEGYTLLSKEYNGIGKRLDYICPNGHKHHITLNMFRYGQRCPKCHKDTRRHTYEFIQSHFQQEGYKLLSPTYQNTKDPLEYQCPKGHKNMTCWNTFQQGRRCPDCHCYYSVAEKEIADLYKHLSPLLRDRVAIRPFELDIYFPTLKVAIEHNGLYWHSDRQERITPQYHRKKMDLCNKQQIRLLTIFEDEWWYQKDICISRINNALGISSNKIYARKCEIKDIPPSQAYEFLKRTHLQGPGSCNKAYGLFYNKQLVQVMTFGSPARAHTTKGKRVLEMKRLAGELNTTIIGGASKIFKKALQYAKDNNYEIVKSYCDLRWGTGNLYKQLGFTKTYETKYTRHYTNGTKRWRNQTLAQNKKKTGTSESEKTEKLGLWKIYDCGHQTWEYVL